LDQWQTIAERKIREAMAAGEFDRLPRRGEPIPLDQNPFEDPSLWMAHHLLRVNGFAPAWIEEAKDIDREVVRFRTDLAGADRLPSRRQFADEFFRRATDINRRILMYNLKSPGPRFHKELIDLDAEIARLDTPR
jgi:hypothetical protein